MNNMQRAQLAEHRLKDYKAPDFLIDHIELTFDLTHSPVIVKSKLKIKQNKHAEDPSPLLTLDGKDLGLLSLSVNGSPVDPSDYLLTPESLTLLQTPSSDFYVESECTISQHSDLFGYYITDGTGLVKAETDGMVYIHFCLNRPDVLSTYTVNIIANKTEFPTLLSNGDLISETNLSDGKHQVTWQDNVPKPCYLFALVAGKFAKATSTFQTRSGKDVAIEFYVAPEAIEKCEYAKQILVKTLKWDEEVFGIEYNHNAIKVTGVNQYASGASEPSTCILFNSKKLFTSAATKIDADTLKVSEVVSHEVAHHLTGNQTTIRDWFNLTFKEGATTFRSSDFREKLYGRDLVQFLDATPLDDRAPRPDTYTAVRSLYTTAAYDKGAAIFRMIKTTLGDLHFYTGMTDFLKHNEGKAITIETLIDHLNKFSDTSIVNYLKWFTEPGTPTVTVVDNYDAKTKRYTLSLTQSCKTPNYQPRPIPVTIALYNQNGDEVVNEQTLHLTTETMEFHFDNLAKKPIPSLLRGRSAPVHVVHAYTAEDLMLLMRHDSNIYNRIIAKNQLMTMLVQYYCESGPFKFTDQLIETYRELIMNKSLNEWLLAEILTLPSEAELIRAIAKPDITKIRQARDYIIKMLVFVLLPEWSTRYKASVTDPIISSTVIAGFDIAAASRRQIQFVCLRHVMLAEDEIVKQIALDQFHKSLTVNMTDTYNALSLLCDMYSTETQTALDDFYLQWQHEPDAVDYWFSVQAASPNFTPKQIDALLTHPGFDITIPNRVYALFNPLFKNPAIFHHASGEGYQILAKAILALDAINPAVAARLIDGFNNWDRFDYPRQKMIYDALQHIRDGAKSENVLEAVNRELSSGKPVPPVTNSFSLLGWLNQASNAVTDLLEDIDKSVGMKLK